MLSEWNGAIGAVFADFSLRVVFAAALVALVLSLTRVRSSAVRHAAWTAVLGAMLLMPVLPYCLPTVTIPIPVPAAAPVPAELLPDAAVPSFFPQDPQVPVSGLHAGTSPVAATETVPQAGIPWMLGVWAVYVLGVMALAFRLMIGWRSAARLARACRPIALDSDFPAPAPGGDVIICESEMVTTPLTMGLGFRRIVLPAGWRLWPGEKLHAVLAHEAAHLRRRDPLVIFLAHLNRCLFWFHPLAWWLERKIAVTAEHACDDAAVRAIGAGRRYAEVLLEMAESVRSGGGRLLPQGVGLDGSGLLGQRIDRIMRGDFFKEISTMRKSIIALCCAATIFLAVTCRRQAAPAPLQEDPARAEQMSRQRSQSDLYKAARSMTREQAAELDAAVKKNPDDFASLEKLLIFYAPISEAVKGETGKWAPICAQVIGEKECIAARRPHILRLIAQHPDFRLPGGLASIYPSQRDPLADPAGYDQAKKMWLTITSKTDASVAVLRNAAAFFEPYDKPLAEKMLLRCRTLDPRGNYSASLGRLYALAVMGANSSMPLNVVRSVSAEDARSPYAQEIRRKLTESQDWLLLATAAQYLRFSSQLRLGKQLGFDPAELGKSLAERARGLNPGSEQTRYAGYLERTTSQIDRFQAKLGNVPRESREQLIFSWPEAERFGFLPNQAMGSYEEGANLEYYKHDAAGAKAAWARARRYAEDAVRLAPKFPKDPDCGRAVYLGNIVLGLVAFREGNRQSAVRYMLAASHAPASDDFDVYLGYHIKLTGYLLKYGERESVIEFLERIAPLAGEREKTSLLDSADKIRKGFRPIWYPRDEEK